jgi:hypothetical protein
MRCIPICYTVKFSIATLGGLHVADIPDTNDPKVAMLAIAWEMAKQVYGGHLKENTHSENVRRITNEVIRIYSALVNLKPISGVQIRPQSEVDLN